MAVAVDSVAAVVVAAALLVAGCGDQGTRRSAGEPTTAVEVYGSCVFCHGDTGDQLFHNGGHGGFDVACETCHADVRPNDPGPGHRAIPACADCHGAQRTHHDPAAGTAAECLSCHTPHGSPNLLLVQPLITRPNGDPAIVDFTNLSGRRDGGFASASDPGTGICETCHTGTRYYRSDGGGEPHFDFPCFTCHDHARSFAAD